MFFPLFITALQTRPACPRRISGLADHGKVDVSVQVRRISTRSTRDRKRSLHAACSSTQTWGGDISLRIPLSPCRQQKLHLQQVLLASTFNLYRNNKSKTHHEAPCTSSRVPIEEEAEGWDSQGKEHTRNWSMGTTPCAQCCCALLIMEFSPCLFDLLYHSL